MRRLNLNKLRQKKGSALISVLVVLFILLTAFFAVFSFALSRAAILEKEINSTRASYLADAGINRFLYEIEKDSLTIDKIISKKLSEKISADEKYAVSAEPWGGYILISSEGMARGSEAAKKVLIGLMPNKDLNAAIINCGANYPVVIAGRTKITGDVIVGPGSITRGTIEGEAYQDEELTDGAIIQRADVTKPEIDNKPIKEYLSSTIEKVAFPDDFIIGSSVITDLDIPRKDTSYIIRVEDNLELKSLNLEAGNVKISLMAGRNITIGDSCHISGTIEIIARNSIIIDGGSYMSGVILAAEDSIVIKGGSIFSGQALCNKTIIISKNAKALYPSLLYAYDFDDDEERTIRFGPDIYSEAIAVLNDVSQIGYSGESKIILDTNSIVCGYLYSDRYIDIRSVLLGIAHSESFWYKKEPTTYINWLRNVVINRNRLDFMPVLPVMFPNQNRYAIFTVYEVS